MRCWPARTAFAPPQVGDSGRFLRASRRAAERLVVAQAALIGVAVSDLYPHFSISGNILDATQFADLFHGTRWPATSAQRSVGTSSTTRLANSAGSLFAELAQYQNTVLQANAEAENALVAFLTCAK